MLYEPSGRETTLELIDQLRARAERYVRLWSRGSGIHRPMEAAAGHARILDLVAKGDGPGARREIERHIASTRDRVVAARPADDADTNGAPPSPSVATSA
jgi:DNA-binding GntR family transcriptional regulator